MDTPTLIRLLLFLTVFITVALWEAWVPRRPLTVDKWLRWRNNLALIGIDRLAAGLVMPGVVLAVAAAADSQGWGLLPWLNLPPLWSGVLAIVILDLVIYLQHLMFHAVPGLWRLHMVHHADLDIDVTTGLRFHPVEILLSLLIKTAAVSALGPPVSAVLLFEILLNATALFNHGNITIPQAIDRWLRLLVVTPDMHRVHHSVLIRETNTNFGFNFPWWDRLLFTYRDQPLAGHLDMTIGLSTFRNQEKLGLLRMLTMPFSGPVAPYSLDRIGRMPKQKRTGSG